jgi:ribonuclease I
MLLLAVARPASAASPVPPLVPTRHGDFDHHPLALTRQPGFCGTNDGCLPDQPHDTLIGLHGLRASLPRTLTERGISDPQRWDRGCDLLHGSDVRLDLPLPLRHDPSERMPQIKDDLLHHEYDKHVQRFGLDTPDLLPHRPCPARVGAARFLRPHA